MTKGICYLVGSGPGDPDLITRKGLECLRKADVIYYDYLANPDLLEEAPQECPKIYVGKKAGDHTLPQDQIDARLVDEVQSGKTVVRLKGGDPFVFGRGGEEALSLARAGLAFEIVPGVTSGVAAAAYAGIPVTQRNMATSVSLITGHETPDKESPSLNWSAIAGMDGTLCFYMGVGNLPLIVEKLLEHGKDRQTPVALIEWGTTSRQRLASGRLETIVKEVAKAEIRPPAMILVGEVVGLRDELHWFDRRPLHGKTILVTRSRQQASTLSKELREQGAETIELPTLQIQSASLDLPESFRSEDLSTVGELEDLSMDPLSKSLLQLKCGSKPDWVVWTSVNGVEEVWKRMEVLNLDARIFAGCQLAAVGSATAQALVTHGLRPDLTPERFTGDALFEKLSEELGATLSGTRFLLLRGNRARPDLAEKLQAAGAVIDEVTAYETHPIESPSESIRGRLLAGEVDGLTFASSSAAEQFVRIIGSDLNSLLTQTHRPRFFSIGPITSETMGKLQLPIDGEAKEHTIAGLVNCVLANIE